MHTLTEMKFFLLIKSSVYLNEITKNNLHEAYEEFISYITRSSYDNSKMNSLYNQLKYAQIELASLKKSGLYKEKKNATQKKYIKKSIHFIDSQLELIKWKTISRSLDFGSNVKTRKELYKNNLHWTGSIVELVEFAYAAHECKSFNNGEIEIKELTVQLSDFFNISVKDCYRVFVDIRQRSGDRTIYIDKLKKKMMERLERADNRIIVK